MMIAQLKEMMDNWNATEAAARAAYPNATEERIYQLTKAVINNSLGL